MRTEAVVHLHWLAKACKECNLGVCVCVCVCVCVSVKVCVCVRYINMITAVECSLLTGLCIVCGGRVGQCKVG